MYGTKKTDNKYRNDFADCELAWASTGNARIFRWLWHGFLQQNMKNKEKRYHPTQKPVGLFAEIIDYYTCETDIILDPFMGVGTTALACEKLNRKWIGIELQEEYCQIAKQRLRKLNSQGMLFV